MFSLSSYLKDLRELVNKQTRADIQAIVEVVEKADSLAGIPNLKKMHGRANYFRIRTGDYRVGIIVESDNVTFVRCLNRADIYKHFP